MQMVSARHEGRLMPIELFLLVVIQTIILFSCIKLYKYSFHTGRFGPSGFLCLQVGTGLSPIPPLQVGSVRHVPKLVKFDN